MLHVINYCVPIDVTHKKYGKYNNLESDEYSNHKLYNSFISTTIYCFM